ncbi:taste receptor type 2 member 40-like [Excalfactoria chinensis]|uniref:taste receptor type 2 member 40-like n=1 Tax=Excalfactoria chinensis TaxID=46218 RepID=UPI003B3A0B4E
MSSLFSSICLIIAIIESVMGLLGNGTILAVSSTSCIRSKILSSYDVIMIFLSLSRFFLELWMMLDCFLLIFCQPSFYKDNLFVTFKTVFIFLNSSSFWFAAWLSVFYCIKVAIFNQSFFICLKQRISSLVPWILITSSLFSIATSLPFSWDTYYAHSNFTTPLTMTNSSERIATRKTNILFLVLLFNFGIALPSIMFVFSSILLIRSLWRHTRQMQNNATGFRDPSLEALTGAIRTVFSFLLLYTANFIALILILSGIFTPSSIEEALCVVVAAACPAGQSMVLIWSNPRFRELPTSILHRISCCVRVGCS